MAFIKCKVMLDQKSRYIDKLFTYKTDLEIKVGMQVSVPFGKGNKTFKGLIIELEPMNEDEENIKEIISVYYDEPIVSLENIKLALWIRENYMCSYRDSLSLFSFKSLKKIKENFEEDIFLIDEITLKETLNKTRKNAYVKLELFEKILKERNFSLSDFNDHPSKTILIRYIRELEKENIICIDKKRKYREIKNEYSHHSQSKNILSDEQLISYKKIIEEIEGKNRPVLLKGITGSGKTEIYLELIETILSKSKGAIVLVPEISLTPQTISRFKSRFGELVAVIHSHLSQGEKADELSRIREMKTPIVVGARSALFAPVENLGMIIIDEAHDDAYRSEQNPKYNAIEVALKINSEFHVPVLLGTATPKIEHFYMAENKELFLVNMNLRANKKPLPQVEVIDMREDGKMGNTSPLSLTLQEAISKEIKREGQVILFLNRRGYASFLSCKSCGYVPKCERCDISLTYHKGKKTLKCHYCNYQEKISKECPSCKESNLDDIGIGTEMIEEEVKSLYKDATIFRMDRDTVSKKGDHSRILSAFKDSKGSILIGTQMIGKGLDFPNVNLVGVINADQGLNIPDFRSQERTFSIIEQVGGRAGRGKEQGKVIVQSFSPGNFTLKYIEKHDYEGFYNEEIKLRECFSYLPFGNIIRVLVTGLDDKKTGDAIMRIKDALEFYLEKKGAKTKDIFGPYPCLITKIDNKYRWQLLIKDTDIEIQLIKSIINYILTEKRTVVLRDGIYATIDINPVNMI
ncbi:primosomal protein N' (replication factor Y) [Acetoanaerobium pronyense]|uniref:Replication restart protein PriA n=1 Tax=Acetoanaerobium pronyense TaxID=1482736 RepID=A0ABS4KFT1_9FIRM|nr:primosomal protein N' [Acetoanaerobium pronyense]MBP2026636.1 primosomal protein N' (replication factor Y) [Acetoanaerobium pronyense]